MQYSIQYESASISLTIPTGQMSLYRLACSCIADANRRDMVAPDDTALLDGRSCTSLDTAEVALQ